MGHELTGCFIAPVVDSTRLGRHLSRPVVSYRKCGIVSRCTYIKDSSNRLQLWMWDGVQRPNEREIGNFGKFETSHEGSALTHHVSTIAVGRGSLVPLSLVVHGFLPSVLIWSHVLNRRSGLDHQHGIVSSKLLNWCAAYREDNGKYNNSLAVGGSTLTVFLIAPVAATLKPSN